MPFSLLFLPFLFPWVFGSAQVGHERLLHALYHLSNDVKECIDSYTLRWYEGYGPRPMVMDQSPGESARHRWPRRVPSRVPRPHPYRRFFIGGRDRSRKNVLFPLIKHFKGKYHPCVAQTVAGLGPPWDYTLCTPAKTTRTLRCHGVLLAWLSLAINAHRATVMPLTRPAVRSREIARLRSEGTARDPATRRCPPGQ